MSTMRKSEFKKVTLPLLLLSLFFVIPACAKKPVLYPNEHYQKVGKQQADKDITYCMKFADENIGKASRGKNAAETGVKSGLVGGAAGLGVGIVTGDIGTKILKGAAGGAAGGAAAGALKSTEDGAYRKFVQRCLRKKGYETTGWR